MRRPLALLGANLVEPLGGHHHDEQSGPIGGGVAEERAPVRVLVPAGVENDPKREHRARRQRERMMLPEGLLVSTRHAVKHSRQEAGRRRQGSQRLLLRGLQGFQFSKSGGAVASFLLLVAGQKRWKVKRCWRYELR